MNIPNIPTDSLYKFLGLSCLFAIVLFMAGQEYMSYEIELKIIDLESQVDILKSNVENAARVANGYHAKRNLLMLRFYEIENPDFKVIYDEDKKKLSELSKKGLLDTLHTVVNDSLFQIKAFKLKMYGILNDQEEVILAEIENLDQKKSDNSDAINKLDNLINKNIKEVKFLNEEMKKIVNLYSGIAFFLFLVFAFSMKAWYSRIQKYQDVIIKQEAGFKIVSYRTILTVKGKVIFKQAVWAKTTEIMDGQKSV